MTDPFASLHQILEERCGSCGTPLQNGACPHCGAIREEPEEILNVVLDESLHRIAVATSDNNLSRLLSALIKLEQGQIGARVVLEGLQPVLGHFRRWRDEMAAMDVATLQNDLEREMYGNYGPLSSHMTVVLETYAEAVAAGDLAQARELMNGLSDGFFVLGELLSRYDN